MRSSQAGIAQTRRIGSKSAMARTTTKEALGSQVLGLREQNKLDKLRRIKDAARELFITKGFDDTTTREIAQRASVGIGTLFIYADNKRDLLFLVANDELEQATMRAHASIRDDASLLQNLLDDLPPALRVLFRPARAVADDAQGNDFLRYRAAGRTFSSHPRKRHPAGRAGGRNGRRAAAP